MKQGQQSEHCCNCQQRDLINGKRNFGFRWARPVMPMVLKELMRHDSVTTTEKFYVGINAQQTAKFLREVTLEVTPKKKAASTERETAEKTVGPEGLEPPTNEL